MIIYTAITESSVMKQLFVFIITVILCCGCSAAQPQSISVSPVIAISKTPVRVDYQRNWAYNAFGESEDPQYLQTLTDALNNVKIGASSEVHTDDYTDIIILTFSDSTKQFIEFEADNYVEEDDSRFEVTQGLSQVRALLDELITEQQ